MTRFLLSVAALVALAACGGPSGTNSAAQMARDAELRGLEPMSGLEPGAPVTTTPLGAAPADGMDAGGAAPRAVTNAVGISQEQDFDAVSGERDIDDDAARLAAARAQYRLIEPSALPTRPGTNVPNIVEYALRTNNPVGTRIYQRSGFNAQNRFERNCARYASPDIAQEEFLSQGGPQRDRRGLDPDGDGFACAWDPTSFRRAVAPPPPDTDPATDG